MSEDTKFQEALDMVYLLVGHFEPLCDSHYKVLAEAEAFLTKHDPIMNIDKAFELLERAKSSHDSTMEYRTSLVGYVGTWAAGQKSSPRISQLLSDCHHLHRQLSSLPEKIHFVVDKE